MFKVSMKMSSLAEKIKFDELCQVLNKIIQLKGGEKQKELNRFIVKCRDLGKREKSRNASFDTSMFPLMRLILSERDRDREAYGLKDIALSKVYNRVLLLNLQIKSGIDFPELVANLTRNKFNDIDDHLSIRAVNEFLESLATCHESKIRPDNAFKSLVTRVTNNEFKWITRIVLKDLRLGIGEKSILKAYYPGAEQLANELSNLREICEVIDADKVELPGQGSGIKLFSHFKPMLLERCTIEQVEKFFRESSQEAYFVQTKYDGERSQLHMKNGTFKYFTRQGFDITNNSSYGADKNSGFLTPKIAALLSPKCKSIILDGELMGWHKAKQQFGSKAMSFDVKKLTANTAHQPCFVAYDIVLYNDELLVNMPYKERLDLLKSLFKEESGIMMMGKTQSITNRVELLDIFNESLDNDDEGIVVKKYNVTYKPNVREGSGCYKIKAEYSDNLISDVDLIVLGGYYGKSIKIGSFLMGVAETPAQDGKNPTKFLSFVGVSSSGLKHEGVRELNAKLEPYYTKERPRGVVGPKSNPPDFWIKPSDSVVMEVRATEMIKSTVYPTDYTLRFPRIIKKRDDKPWYNTCSLKEIQSLVKNKDFVQKLTKRAATVDDIQKATTRPAKSTRMAGHNMSKIVDDFKKVSTFDLEILTRLFLGKEVCVVNGSASMTKQDIEKILVQHQATIVQTQRSETFCVIVGDETKPKAKTVIHSERYNVVKLDWLLRATKQENWENLVTWYPWELLSSTVETKKSISQKYDKYDDSYCEDATEESLKHSLAKIDIENVNFNEDELADFRRELFGDAEVPNSQCKGIIGYFDNERDCEKYKFEFMDGQVCDELDETVTHVFIDEERIRPLPVYKNLNRDRENPFKIVLSTWIDCCFRNKRLESDNEYTISKPK